MSRLRGYDTITSLRNVAKDGAKMQDVSVEYKLWKPLYDVVEHAMDAVESQITATSRKSCRILRDLDDLNLGLSELRADLGT